MMQPQNIPHKGFTLVETMVAVSILIFAVAGPLYTASRGLVAAEVARDQLTASFLAQEGIEYVRAMRDNEYLSAYQSNSADASAIAWSSFLTGSSAGSITPCRTSSCMFDPMRLMGAGPGLALQPCSGSSCTPLYKADNIYTEQSGLTGAVITPFTRTIQIVDMSPTDERIVSRVVWSFHQTTYSVTITDHLTPWQ